LNPDLVACVYEDYLSVFSPKRALLVGRRGWVLAVGSGIALLGNWLREFRPGLAVLDGRPGGALAGDALFSLLAVVAALGVWAIAGAVSAGGVLAATGVAATIAAMIGFPRSCEPAAPATGNRHVVRVAVAQARWTFPGAVIAWPQQSGYIYAVGFVLGPAAVGEMAAARLFVVPLLLVAVAWGRLFLPQATALLADGGEAVLRARCGRALRIALVGSGLYLVVPAGAFVVGVGRLLPADYAGCGAQILVWGGFGVVNLVRTIASTALMARLEFRALFAMTLVSAGVCLVGAVVLIGPLGAMGAVVGIAPSGAAIEYSTFLGGTRRDVARSIVARDGFAYVSGTTSSADFPTKRPLADGGTGGTGDVFLARIGDALSIVPPATTRGRKARKADRPAGRLSRRLQEQGQPESALEV
jgi:hypothetical protein